MGATQKFPRVILFDFFFRCNGVAPINGDTAVRRAALGRGLLAKFDYQGRVIGVSKNIWVD